MAKAFPDYLKKNANKLFSLTFALNITAMNRIYFILISLFMWAACSQQGADKETSQTDKTEKKSPENKAVVHQDSELAAWMKEMHSQLFTVKDALEKGEPVPDSINWDWEAIYKAQRSNDDARGETFNGMARAFLIEMQKSIENNDVEAYNHAVRSCVNCHENYCPGPIPKIKKLKISQPDRS